MDKKKVLLYLCAGLWTLCVILLAVSAIRIYMTGAAYQADGHPEAWIFTRERAGDALRVAAPAFILAVFSSLIYKIFVKKDYKEKLCFKQENIVNNSIQICKKNTLYTGNNRKIKVIWICLALISAFFIISGVINGSLMDVLIKAINICTECIGLG